MRTKDQLRKMLIQVPCRCGLSALNAESEIDDLWDDFKSGDFSKVSWRAKELYKELEKVEDKCTIDLGHEKNILTGLTKKADESSNVLISEVSIGLVSKLRDCAD